MDTSALTIVAPCGRGKPIASNGVITYSMAWQWMCMAIDLQELLNQLPEPRMSWRSDAPSVAQIQWLHDCSHPEWGHVTAWANFENQTHFIGLSDVLKKEIIRYREMKKLIGWRLPAMQEEVKNGTW